MTEPTYLDELAWTLANRRPRVLPWGIEADDIAGWPAEPCTKCNGRGYVAECEASDEIECHCIGGPRVCLQCAASHRCPSCDGDGQL